MIIADVSKASLEEIVVELNSDLEKELTKKIPAGFTLTYPILELEDGTMISQTTAIAEYLSETGAAPSLLGSSEVERSQVDQWMQFIRMHTLSLARTLSGSVFGHIQLTAAEYAYVAGLFKENAKLLNNHLKGKLWIAGTAQPTIADYQLAICLIELQQCVMDTNLRNSLNNLNDHFKKVAALPEF